jgi:uncharacterized protein (DUF1778 family)
MTMARTERIEMRTTQEEHDLITRAADASHVTTSSFVLAAARSEASRVLARADVTIMPADQFDELMAALDTPEPIPTLARLAAAPRRFTRR